MTINLTSLKLISHLKLITTCKELYQDTACHTAAEERLAAEEDIHLELDTADTSDLGTRQNKVFHTLFHQTDRSFNEAA